MSVLTQTLRHTVLVQRAATLWANSSASYQMALQCYQLLSSIFEKKRGADSAVTIV